MPSFHDIILSIGRTLYTGEELVKGLSWLLALGMFFHALLRLYRLVRVSSDTHSDSYGAILVQFLAASVLAAIGWSMTVASATVLGRSSLVAYELPGAGAGVSGEAKSIVMSFLIILRICGWIWFIKGWRRLVRASKGQGSSEDKPSSAIVQICAATGCVNAAYLVSMAQATIGLTPTLMSWLNLS